MNNQPGSMYVWIVGKFLKYWTSEKKLGHYGEFHLASGFTFRGGMQFMSVGIQEYIFIYLHDRIKFIDITYMQLREKNR